ncbi:hypothetical protein EMIHUDRAFT_449313 [Emiliania huxleyi CCMP1516]|uniref:tRNA (Uracil-5-)-methyltransferase n=2 Tax=Emiliania huxleyi TaxID=2903 RepID=A0A0D3KER6_EMIH1|nr:hypothetical protein EMIHUDRAFT_449313 [Emiliania huxleyi CCMP1516]EOD34251.1 hypothetical protein EMIHUDRAFT_449313 [Emiliania huxleyi CCMP1516]|eukprot:XP_005786680.1 hypothetical protein EMIHUDRAFT_449313 [Emiliania huxleyi CCMP1516]
MAATAPIRCDGKVTWMAFEPESYEHQLQEKTSAMRSLFGAVLAGVEVQIFPSMPAHFRQRARFAMCRFDGVLKFALFDKDAPRVAVDRFPVASREINELMPRLLAAVASSEALSTGLEACHFLGTQTGDMLVSLIYGEPMHSDWRGRRAAAEAMRAELSLPALLGRAKGTRVVLDRDSVDETYALHDGRRLTYRQVEGSFSNPSAAIRRWTGSASNHTVALATHFSHVLAVEIDRRLCAAAEHNLASNGVRNATVLAADSGRFCRSLLRKLDRGAKEAAAGRTAAPPDAELGGREEPTQPAAEAAAPSANPTTRWLEEARGRTDVILVDPPRCGLDADTLRLVSYFDHVLYISCNPEALLDNLQRGGLLQTHAVVRSAIFDHFAYTPHLECAVLLRRRTLCE